MDLATLENVGKIYCLGKVEISALTEVSLSVKEGDFACLVGPSSSSGKTTILNLIGCRLGQREAGLFRGQRLGFVFQGFNLLPMLTIYENVEYPPSCS